MGISDTNARRQLRAARVCSRAHRRPFRDAQPVHDYGYLIHEFDPWSTPQTALSMKWALAAPNGSSLALLEVQFPRGPVFVQARLV